jgi:preprotein translocase subunit SecA
MKIMERASYALSTARGIPIEYDLGAYRSIVRKIEEIDLSRQSDASLFESARNLHARLGEGGNPDKELAGAFALVREACRRTLGVIPYEEQLIAGIAMHRGRLVQMQTGEGKTLAAVFPACLNAMGGGVHVMTANDYLAHRDAEWMRPIYERVGLSVASINERMDGAERNAAYRSDVTYLTTREVGFDYLRDQLRYQAAEIVQRGFSMAIVDEADFILVDCARIPLVIAGEGDMDGIDILRVDRLARELLRGREYEVDRECRRVSILPEGHRRIEAAFGIRGIHEERGARHFARIYASLHAHHLLRKDVDYVIKGGRLELVDELTGRIADKRQWPYGIQAALEAKEGLELRREGRVYASITILHFMGLYGKLAAMTATAVPSAEELSGSYGLSTLIIPTVRPVQRIDQPDAVFRTRGEKMRALVREISQAHAVGRPVLVGTASVRESQELAGLIAESGVPCQVLNAKNDEHEAELIARAGHFNAVTISTNMAGRGTDIKPDENALALGGLYVIGTNRHESRRIDDQLRGRAGRQGEPGSSRFFISLEDPLFERYGVREFLPPESREMPSSRESGDPDGCGPIEDARVLREINRAQAIIEAQNHAMRRSLQKYSLIVELDRRRVRMLRDEALLHGRLPSEVENACPDQERRPLLIQAYLSLLDRFWADHLLFVDEVREGIHLERYAGRDPGLEYVRRIGDAFEAGLKEVERSTVSALTRVGEDPSVDPRSLGISRPSSTWTYQIEEESPPGFHLAMVASARIGAAVTEAALLLILKAAGLCVRIGKKLWRLLRGNR